MRGCLSRLVRAVVLIVVIGGIAYFFRDKLRIERTGTAASSIVWEPLTTERGARGRAAVQRLGRPSGPVFETLSPGELASYIFLSLGSELPPSSDSIQAAVIGDRMAIRASVKLSDLGGTSILGPFAGMFGEREQVQFGGTFDVLRDGLAQYRILDLRIREFNVPSRLIPRIVSRIDRGARPDSIAPDALPLEIPRHIGDVRIARGRVTLYRTTTR